MENIRIITAESVRCGHPDKFCDQIADRILDAHLEGDPNARVAVEVFATAGKIIVAGEVTSTAQVNYRNLVWEIISDVGYEHADLCLDPNAHLDIEVRVHEQSPDIAQAVSGQDEQGAGDQGIMVGYATDETREYMPLPVDLAHRLCIQLDQLANDVRWLGTDGKAQVTVAYEGDAPKEVMTVVVSVQHAEDASLDDLRTLVLDKVVSAAIPKHLITANTLVLINPSGKFVLGGPVADTGLTGRKLAVDQYGPIARMGGGALSGKDASKVDRSGAYAARWIAKNIVAAGLAKRCEVQIAYAIGRAAPVGVSVDTFQTGSLSDAVLATAVQRTFDLRPSRIIDQLELWQPRYTSLAAYGHYGRNDIAMPWEITKHQVELRRAVDKLNGGK